MRGTTPEKGGQGLHEITDYKEARPCMVNADETQANELDSFYARFEASNANAGHADAGLINGALLGALPVRQHSTLFSLSTT